MRDFINTVNNILLEGEVHNFVPDIGAIIQVFDKNGEIESWPPGRPREWRVNGWLKSVPDPVEPDMDDPNVPFEDHLKFILASGNRKFDYGRGETRLVNCTRAEAEYVTGVGVSGIIKPIDQVKVVGRVNWPEEHIEEERAAALRRVGQIIF